MKKLFSLFLLGIFLVGIGSIAEAKKDSRVFLKTDKYVTQSEPISYGIYVIDGAKYRINVDVRTRCENCKFHKFIDGQGNFRVYGTFENNRVSIEVKNIHPTDVVFDKDSSVIKATATVIIYEEDEFKQVSQREEITINTYKEYFEIIFADGTILGKFYTTPDKDSPTITWNIPHTITNDFVANVEVTDTNLYKINESIVY